ncbi:MAG: Dabb family protein [Verrucomicrobiota bacterium]
MEHHVYFWLKEEFKGEAARGEFEAGLAGLFEIETVAGGIWGKSAGTEERPVTDKSWDYALSLHFESQAEHDAYQVDPKHDGFVEAFKERWAKVLVMDVAPG